MPDSLPTGEDKRHSRDGIAVTAKKMRDAGALRGMSQEQAERRVRDAVRKTNNSEG